MENLHYKNTLGMLGARNIRIQEKCRKILDRLYSSCGQVSGGELVPIKRRTEAANVLPIVPHRAALIASGITKVVT